MVRCAEPGISQGGALSPPSTSCTALMKSLKSLSFSLLICQLGIMIGYNTQNKMSIYILSLAPSLKDYKHSVHASCHYYYFFNCYAFLLYSFCSLRRHCPSRRFLYQPLVIYKDLKQFKVRVERNGERHGEFLLKNNNHHISGPYYVPNNC